MSYKCSKTKIYCSHKAVAKWFLKQERPQCFQSNQTSILEDNGINHDETGQCIETDENENDDVAVNETDNNSEEGEIIKGDTIQIDPVFNYTMMKRISEDVRGRDKCTSA